MTTADELKTVRIKANLIADKSLRLLEISASFHDGIAYMSGEVETQEQKDLAEALAYEVEGVYEVVNDINIEPDSLRNVLRCTLENGDMIYCGISAEDEDIAVEHELKSRLSTAFGSVSVSLSKHKIVQLNGRVSSEKELIELKQMVLRTNGIIGIDSHIEVASI